VAHYFQQKNNSQSGQTLIETIIAIFMLTVAMVATLGSLQYLLQSSDYSSKQNIASGLAAEGISMVKNTRDTHWLEQKPIAANCPELQKDPTDPTEPLQPCYSRWLIGNPGGVDGLIVGTTYLPFVRLNNFKFDFTDNVVSVPTFALKYATNPSNGAVGYVNSQPSACAGSITCVSTIYYRKVVLTDATPFPGVPFQALDPIVKVTSSVWWRGRGCPATEDPSTVGANCKVIVVDYLTNWKNY